MIFEVCVDSVEGAVEAQAGGAQRVELCDNLVEGGTTPSLGMIQVVRQKISIELHVIIRPRGSDFLYSEAEFEVMRQDIQAAKAAGANGVVIGLLNQDGSIDLPRTRALVELARPLSVTFHRAFDVSRDAQESLEALCSLGIERVLTSGQQASAFEGADCIAQLVRQAGDRICILAGGGITEANVAEIVRKTGVKEVHFSARRWIESPMQSRNRRCVMGRAYEPDEYRRRVTDAGQVARVIQAAARGLAPVEAR